MMRDRFVGIEDGLGPSLEMASWFLSYELIVNTSLLGRSFR